MRLRRLAIAALLGTSVLVAGFVAFGQAEDQMPGLPADIPPPLPPPPKPEEIGNYEPIVPASDAPWGLEPELLDVLYRKAELYGRYTRRFACRETARVAEYDADGAVKKERRQDYGYLLVKSDVDDQVREYRQEVGKDGSLSATEAKDEEPFPPAYAWVFLFSRFHEPFFSFRYRADRFDGFDWVHEIEFKGSRPFTDGKDIRQWEGKVLIDAVTHTPLEIVAEPTGQRERIEALYLRWSKSFNMFGFRTGPRPFGYRAHVQFRLHREGLSFPTNLRYDTFRAVGPRETVPTRASTREYTDYRIFEVTPSGAVGQPVD